MLELSGFPNTTGHPQIDTRIPSTLVLCALLTACNATLEDPPRFWDFNGDGIEDLSEELGEDGSSHFEVLDRNYDGKPDSRTQYDSARFWPIFGLTDDDFDGDFETRVIYQNAWVYAVVSDTNRDNLYDVIHFYKDGVRSRSIRHREEPTQGSVTTISYSYEFPVTTTEKKVDQTSREFHDHIVSTLPHVHDLPAMPSNR